MDRYRQSTDDPAESMEIACSLNQKRYTERTAAWRELVNDTEPEYLPDGGFKFRFPSERCSRVLELIAAEHQCCPFVTFHLSLTNGYIELETHVPEGAEPLLAELFGAHTTSTT